MLTNSYYIVLFLLVTSLAHTQIYNDVKLTSDFYNVHNKKLQIGSLSPRVIGPVTVKSISKNNTIYIQQIGNHNHVYSNTRSAGSNIKLYQKGNRNKMVLNIDALHIDETVLQRGNNNKFVDLSKRGTILHNATVMQYGENQNLISMGSNSISEKMIIRMRGRNQTVIIRNIKRK